MKQDREIQRDVIDELSWEPSVKDRSADIGVAARDGIVTLTGGVQSYAQKYAALRAAERVVGVRAVADELVVRVPGLYARSDTDIAQAAANALRWDVEVPEGSIKMRVHEGWVLLEGRVDWFYQKAAAERAVRYLTGVTGVTNRIEVTPKPSVAEVQQQIEDALTRSAEVDASQVQVSTHDGVVTLTGRVHSAAARENAERAAWSAPGVRVVRDELSVVV